LGYYSDTVPVLASGVVSVVDPVSVVCSTGGVTGLGSSFLPGQPIEKHARQATIRVSAINFFIFISPYVLHKPSRLCQIQVNRQNCRDCDT